MDQRISIGVRTALARPIHGACVVPGCWCGSTRTTPRSNAGDRLRAAGRGADRATTTATNLTSIALRSVGLPVV